MPEESSAAPTGLRRFLSHLPRWQYIAIAGMLFIAGSALQEAEVTQRAKRAADVLIKDLELLDPIYLTRTFYEEFYFSLHDCVRRPSCRIDEEARRKRLEEAQYKRQVCERVCDLQCRAAATTAECLACRLGCERVSLRSPVTPFIPREEVICDGPEEIRCARGSLTPDAGTLGNLVSKLSIRNILTTGGIFATIFNAVTKTWARTGALLSTAGLVILGFAAAGGALIMSGVYDALFRGGGEGFFKLYGFILFLPLSVPLAAGAIALGIKWLLIGLLMLFGALVGLIAWALGILKLATSLIGILSTARDLESITGNDSKKSDSRNT